MSMVAVTTLRELGGAEVAKEALADRGIPVEIKRLSNFTLYFGAPAAEEFEVRVPEEQVAEARLVLEALSADLEERLYAEAGIPPAADARGDDELPPPERRPRKPAWAIGISLIAPVPGFGLLYARAFPLGFTFLGIGLTLYGAAVGGRQFDALFVLAALKVLDAVLAPLFAARFNHQLKEPAHAA
jgi:hypothetical protein